MRRVLELDESTKKYNFLIKRLCMDTTQGGLSELGADDTNGDESMASSGHRENALDTPPVSTSQRLRPYQQTTGTYSFEENRIRILNLQHRGNHCYAQSRATHMGISGRSLDR